MSGREALKAFARGVAHLLSAPFWISYRVRALVLGRDRALLGSTQLLSMVPGLAGQYIRRAFLQHAIESCHHTVVVEYGTTLSRAGARLDDYAYIGPACHLGLVHVERDVLIAAGVHIPSGARTHSSEDVDLPIREQGRCEQLVRIGAGSWIGAGAVVMAHVGPNSIVGAGAVVTRPLMPEVVAGGVPARVLRQRGRAKARAV
jgi:acetyltransferase-like isoleucine patch superfamily enzyme